MKVNTTEALKDKRDILNNDAALERFIKGHKRVCVTIPKIEGQDNIVECGINGYNMLLKRGEPLELPENIVELLRNAEII